MRQQEEVGATPRHHAAFTRLIDEYRDAAGELGVGLNEVVHHTFALEVFAGEVAEAIATNLADEVCVESAATRPHGDICGTASRGQHHFAERVTTLEHLVIGANENIPREVTNDAQTHAFTLPMQCSVAVGVTTLEL
ncbi:MAG: hypothetical protein EBV66_02190 [Actinobacteria bacterium]|nr:hypothetical protein [Actinomycetota bacterium]